MSKELINRIRKNRELKIETGGLKLIARRPTDVEAVRLHQEGASLHDICRRFVIGWDGVTENDVAGGGGTDPVPFDSDLWAEYCADRPDIWAPVAERILEAYKLHAERHEAAAKN